MRNITHT